MTFDPFQKFIREAAARKGIAREFFAAEICNDFRKALPEVFEDKKNIENFGEYVRPASYKNGELVIEIASAGWAQEIMIRRHRIIEKINQKEGKEVIRKLRTKLKQ